MTKLTWDSSANRKYETGVDQGILFIPDGSGAYLAGVPWNGLTTVTESPSGGESTPEYADNIQYLTLLSLEMFGGTIEAYTYPDEFGLCDGMSEQDMGVFLGQQDRQTFALAYRTKVGNADTPNLGYKWHLIYNMLAKPSEKAYATLNDSPDPIAFSWDFTTTPSNFDLPAGFYAPFAMLVIDTTKLTTGPQIDALAAFELILLGTDGDPEADPVVPPTDPTLQLPGAILDGFDV